MRVMYLCDEYFHLNKGFTTHAREFSKAFSELPGVTCLEAYSPYFCQNDENATEQKSPQQSRCRFLPKPWRVLIRRLHPRFKAYQKLRETVRSGQFQVIVVRSNTKFNVFYRRLKRDFPGLRIVVEVNAVPLTESRIYENSLICWLVRYIEARTYIKFVCGLSVVSRRIREHYQHCGFPSNRIVVNQNGVNIQQFQGRDEKANVNKRKELGIPRHAFVLGYIGGMESWRRIPEWVAIICDIMPSEDDMVLVVIGEGEDKVNLEKKMAACSPAVNRRVFLLGWQAHDSIPLYLSMFDVALYPFFALSHGSPQKIFEYLGMGLPTIGPDVEIMTDVLTSGVHLMLTSQDGSTLKKDILELKHNVKYREQLGVEGGRFVRDNFTWHHNAKVVYDLIQKDIK